MLSDIRIYILDLNEFDDLKDEKYATYEMFMRVLKQNMDVDFLMAIVGLAYEKGKWEGARGLKAELREMLM